MAPIEIELTDDLAPPTFAQEESTEKGQSEEERSARRTWVMIGRHVDAIYQAQSGDGVSASLGRADGVSVHEFDRFLTQYSQSDKVQEARLALIVRLAQATGSVVESVGSRPRYLLRRVRQLERVARTRQLDPACMRWLVRQPGSSLAERAGSRQRVLAVVREEIVNTLENRVVRDLLERAIVECAAYQDENKHLTGSERLRVVRGFQRLCRRVRRFGPLADVPRITGAVQPNYVLQHDERYGPLWRWYLRLRRKQLEEDRLWRWKQRTNAEVGRLILESAVHEIEKRAGLDRLGFTGRLLLRHEQEHGGFIDERSDCVPRALSLSSGRPQVTLLDGSRQQSWEDYAQLDHSISGLCPDVVGVLHPPSRPNYIRSVCAFWFRILRSDQSSDEGMAELVEGLSRRSHDFPLEAVVIDVGHEGSGRVLHTETIAGGATRTHVLALPSDPAAAVESLSSHLEAWLGVS